MLDLPGKTYPCVEHEKVHVPITEIVVDGKAELFPEVSGLGLFDIDFQKGELVLKAKNYIGNIPVNQRVNIHVTPRFPIANVLYLVQKAKAALRFLPGRMRGYTVERLNSDHPEELFGESLLNCLIEIEKNGLMRRYEAREVERGWKGRLLMAPTVSRFVSKGDHCHQVRQLTELSTDIYENQFVKGVLTQLGRYFVRLPDKASRELARRCGALLRLFDRVSDFSGPWADFAQSIPAAIKSLPGAHKSYEQVLWLCYLIATKQGIRIESFGPARIESMIINLESVFEDYVRQVIREGIGTILPGGYVKDGNITKPSLFVENSKNSVMPDIYLLKGKQTVAILDAKYKYKLIAADRYELIAFCEVLRAKCAIFLLPSEGNAGETTFLGTTPGGIEMYQIKMALGAVDIRREEKELLNSVQIIVSKHALI